MSDLRGFTALAARLTPHDVIAFLNLYLEAMVDVIGRYEGTIDEILGDAILVIFGAPVAASDHAVNVIACGLAMQLAMPEPVAGANPGGEIYAKAIGAMEDAARQTRIRFTSVSREIKVWLERFVPERRGMAQSRITAGASRAAERRSQGGPLAPRLDTVLPLHRSPG
jgi:class 3 adenylate cyclase